MVGMCGEAASDPLMIPLLLAFGLNEFSMSASAVLNARKLITGYSIACLLYTSSLSCGGPAAKRAGSLGEARVGVVASS